MLAKSMLRGRNGSRLFGRRGVTFFGNYNYSSGLFIDSFSGANGVTLPSHTPEKGGPWFTGNGNDIVLDGSGRAIPVANGPSYINVTGNLGTWREVTFDCIYRRASADPGVYGVIVDWVDSNNYAFLGGLFALYYVYTVDLGANTLISNSNWPQGAPSDGQRITITVVNTGTSLKLYRDGALTYTYVRGIGSNVIGIYTQSNSGIGNRVDIDRLVVK